MCEGTDRTRQIMRNRDRRDAEMEGGREREGALQHEREKQRECAGASASHGAIWKLRTLVHANRPACPLEAPRTFQTDPPLSHFCMRTTSKTGSRCAQRNTTPSPIRFQLYHAPPTTTPLLPLNLRVDNQYDGSIKGLTCHAEQSQIYQTTPQLTCSVSTCQG